MNRKRENNTARKGFTLTESLVAIALAVVVSGVALESIDWDPVIAEAQASSDRYQLGSWMSALACGHAMGLELDYSSPEALVASGEAAGLWVATDPGRMAEVLAGSWDLISKINQ